jgi:amino acid adenylation domain-containing protein/thioester reductase-like protein
VTSHRVFDDATATLAAPRLSLTAGRRHPGRFTAVPAQIEARADQHPHRTAVSFAGTDLSYQRLDELANGLAAELAAAGVRRGRVVPLLLANRLELPVACLAVLKLGAAFVPLDPHWPVDRLRAILAAMPPGPAVSGRAGMPGGHDGPAVVADLARLVPTPARPGVEVGPDDLMYGIFTSGTTGTPKCAMNRQGGLANRFAFMTRYFAATGSEVVLQNSPHTVDSALWQLLWPLTIGGKTVLPPRHDYLDLHRTIDLIAAQQVTASDFVSSVFNALVTVVEGDPALPPKLASLRWLIVGSEPVNPYAVRRLTGLLPDLRVTNGYGPTETSIGMAFHPMGPDDGDLVPLGRPIDNCGAAVLDDRLRPVPTGEVGEIAVGGACMGEGYLNSPAPTARAFVPNPFQDQIPGSRLYLTGDLGHTDEQGRLFFVGRKDFQVKIGGNRIELGEVQAAAESCPGVWQAEVLVAEEDPGRSLALFVACSTTPTEAQLRAHLLRSLPRASVPARYFLLAAMPLTDTGKVDRRELTSLLDQRLAADAAALAGGAPGSTLGERVLQAMRAALRNPNLAAQEHFMDAGGDSLLALSVVNAIRAGFGVQEVCAQDLFDHPTAERLTLVVQTYQADAAVALSEDELMERDAAPAAERFRPALRPDRLDTVLVTGATGFVGSRIVHELLVRTGCEVVCLARAGDDGRATGRVVRALAARGLWAPAFAGRVRAIAADLALPRLGIPAATWESLADTCDLLLNTGAMVNFLYDYRAHRRANVLGAAQLLRLAVERRPVPLYHVSTLAVLEGADTGAAGPLDSGVAAGQVPRPPGGYNRSKWVAERYLDAAAELGATVTVLRLGELMPAADNGRANPMALTHLLLSAFRRLGLRPDVELWTDYTPVDHAARHVVAAAAEPALDGRRLHLLRPGNVDLADLLPAAGLPLETTSCRRFLSALNQAVASTGDAPLRMLAALLPAPDGAAEPVLRDRFAALLTDNARRYRSDTPWPADEPLTRWVGAYLERLREAYPVGAGPL